MRDCQRVTKYIATKKKGAQTYRERKQTYNLQNENNDSFVRTKFRERVAPTLAEIF